MFVWQVSFQKSHTRVWSCWPAANDFWQGAQESWSQFSLSMLGGNRHLRGRKANKHSLSGIRLWREGRGFWKLHKFVLQPIEVPLHGLHWLLPGWKKISACISNAFASCFFLKKTFLMCRLPGKRWLQTQSLILPSTSFSETIGRCRCFSMGARWPPPSPGFSEVYVLHGGISSGQMTQTAHTQRALFVVNSTTAYAT